MAEQHVHDRSLPDHGPEEFSVEDDGTVLFRGTYDEARLMQDEHYPKAIITISEQRVADDGLLGCNDCGRRLYWCETEHWYFHVEEGAECFLAGAPCPAPAKMVAA